jgi:hypothetical protein
MKLRNPLALIVVIGAIGFMADTTWAATISLSQGKGKIADCKAGGGTSWVPGKTGHTSGCMNADGSGVVCGGVTSAQKNSCSTFRVRSQDVGGIRVRLGGSAKARK